MEQEPEQQEPTQETDEGLTIPVPKREDFFRDLGKVAKPQKSEGEREDTPRGE